MPLATHALDLLHALELDGQVVGIVDPGGRRRLVQGAFEWWNVLVVVVQGADLRNPRVLERLLRRHALAPIAQAFPHKVFCEIALVRPVLFVKLEVERNDLLKECLDLGGVEGCVAREQRKHNHTHGPHIHEPIVAHAKQHLGRNVLRRTARREQHALVWHNFRQAKVGDDDLGERGATHMVNAVLGHQENIFWL